MSDIPRGIDISTVLDQDPDDLDVTAGTGSMEREDTVKNGVDGLAVVKGILDEPKVARRSGFVETKLGDWMNRSGRPRHMGAGTDIL